jgi:hypothetical protein
MKTTLLIAIFLFTLTNSASAGPTFYGEEGFINTPASEIIPERNINLGLSYLPGNTSYIFTGKPNLIYSVFFQFLPRTEVGIVFNQVFGWATPDNPYLKGLSSFDRSIGLKFQILDEGDLRPSISIGGRDITSNSLLNTAGTGGTTSSLQQIFYVAAGKKFNGFKFNLGYSYAPVVSIGVENNEANKDKLNQNFRPNGFFAAVETPKIFSLISGIIEYDTKHFNYGLDIGPVFNLRAKLAMIDLINFNFRLALAAAL